MFFQQRLYSSGAVDVFEKQSVGCIDSDSPFSTHKEQDVMTNHDPAAQHLIQNCAVVHVLADSNSFLSSEKSKVVSLMQWLAPKPISTDTSQYLAL